MRITSRLTCLTLLGLSACPASAGELAPLSVSFPAGVPLVLSSSDPTAVHALVSTGGDTIVSDSVRLIYRAGQGAFQEITLTPGAGSVFSGVLPAGACGTEVEWFVTAEGVASGIVNEPPGAANAPFTAVVGTAVPFISYDFQTAPGWTVNGGATFGAWALGVPVGCNRGDPPGDYDGSGSCYLTQPSTANFPLACDSDVDGGVTRVISPAFNLAALANPHIRYARWYTNALRGEAHNDTLQVDLSDDGGSNWLSIEEIGPSLQAAHPEIAGGWYPRIVRIADLTESFSAIRVRFTAYDLGVGSTVEAGIDGFSIVDLSCQPPGCLRGDLNGDGRVNGPDVAPFVRLVVQGGAGPAEVCAGDLEAGPDGSLDAGDVGGFVACLLAGGCG